MCIGTGERLSRSCNIFPAQPPAVCRPHGCSLCSEGNALLAHRVRARNGQQKTLHA